MENISLYNKLATLPEQMKSEVADFIDFLAEKAKKSGKASNTMHRPKFGSGKGMFIMERGFDEPLDDFKDYMHQ